MLIIGWLAACAPETDADPVPPAAVARASLDLRGVRPSVAELDQVAADPDAFGLLVDQWLREPAFRERVRDVFALAYRTRLDAWTPQASELGLAPELDPAFQVAVGEEPLQIVAEVATADLRYDTVVTANWTMVDPTLAAVWPVTPSEREDGWRRAAYTDGRPMAGVLSTNGLWWRYTSTMENYNRGRANALSRILLCSDYLARPVVFPRSDAAPGSDALLDQTKTDPSCSVCHVSLDPLGSYLYGFEYGVETYYMTPRYTPSAEAMWRGRTDIPPAYYGEAVNGLDGLGRAIAGDPRFAACAVETVLEGVHQVEIGDADFLQVARHLERFEASDRRLRALFRSVVLDDGNLAEDAPRKLLPVESLVRSVEALTGFHWTIGGRSVLGQDIDGLRTLAGGFDGKNVTRPLRQPNPTVLLVQRRLAELAATHAVAHPENPLFLGDLPSIDDDAAWRRLFMATLSRPPSSAERDAFRELWGEVATDEGEAAAWAAVVTALLRHPDFVTF